MNSAEWKCSTPSSAWLVMFRALRDRIPLDMHLGGLGSKVNRGNGFAAGCAAWLCLAGRS